MKVFFVPIQCMFKKSNDGSFCLTYVTEGCKGIFFRGIFWVVEVNLKSPFFEQRVVNFLRSDKTRSDFEEKMHTSDAMGDKMGLFLALFDLVASGGHD